jgi:hypothetical protein
MKVALLINILSLILNVSLLIHHWQGGNYFLACFTSFALGAIIFTLIYLIINLEE